jgi:hypothetical protein
MLICIHPCAGWSKWYTSSSQSPCQGNWIFYTRRICRPRRVPRTRWSLNRPVHTTNPVFSQASYIPCNIGSHHDRSLIGCNVLLILYDTAYFTVFLSSLNNIQWTSGLRKHGVTENYFKGIAVLHFLHIHLY